jgi:surfeit locus 1 family protein
LQPVIVQQHNDLGDGLVRNWPRPDARIDVHRAYALQWFAMSAAIVILYLVLYVRRRKTPQRAA